MRLLLDEGFPSPPGFDALVTRDWHQSEQIEELWALSRTDLSVITWRRPIEDPIREWGQLLAYLPEIRWMITENGPSIVFLPSPRLDRKNLEKVTGMLGQMAKDLGLSVGSAKGRVAELRSLLRFLSSRAGPTWPWRRRSRRWRDGGTRRCHPSSPAPRSKRSCRHAIRQR